MRRSQLLARLWLFPPQLLINAALGKKPVDSVMNIQIYLSHIIAYAALFTPGVSEAGEAAAEAVGGAGICPACLKSEPVPTFSSTNKASR